MLRGTSLLASAARAGSRSVRVAPCVSRSYSSSSSSSGSKGGSIGKKLLWLTVLGGGSYAGAAYLALHNEAFHDTYTTYVPGGEQVLDFFEDAASNRDVQDYYEKGMAAQKQASNALSQLSTSAGHLQDTLADWYDYLGDAIALLKGETMPPAASTAPPSLSGRKKQQQQQQQPVLFDHVVEGGGPARIPSFTKTNDEQLHQLIATTETLIILLNEIGLTGHAKRLSDLATRDIKALNADIQRANDDQKQVLAQLQSLVKKANQLDTAVTNHYDQVVKKVTDARDKVKARINEKTAQFQQHLDIELRQLQQTLAEQGEQQLNAQRDAARDELQVALRAQVAHLRDEFTQQIKQAVEQERGGRLANVEGVVHNQAILEQLAHRNAESLEDCRKAHQLLVAIDALKRAAYKGNKQAFLDELQTVRKVSAPATPFANAVEKQNDALVQVVSANISETVAEHGISSMAQLVDRFDKVAEQVREASLIPEEGSSMISHMISILLSKLLFPKQGLVQGDDMEARLARATYYLQHDADLESATREINQLKGWPKHLAADWLDAARRHLEIKQALDIMRTQAVLNSLLQLD
ncbi:mitochondrial inner membrane protein-domain-containing protein [Gongronella butleri]|nr:mitochondrial inner membrane protein-domain-containing protein [Gongronella butleri]